MNGLTFVWRPNEGEITAIFKRSGVTHSVYDMNIHLRGSCEPSFCFYDYGQRNGTLTVKLHLFGRFKVRVQGFTIYVSTERLT